MGYVPFVTGPVWVKHSWVHLVIKRGQSPAHFLASLIAFIVLFTDVFLTSATSHTSSHNFSIATVNLIVLGCSIKSIHIGDVFFVGFGHSALLVRGALFTSVELVVGKWLGFGLSIEDGFAGLCIIEQRRIIVDGFIAVRLVPFLRRSAVRNLRAREVRNLARTLSIWCDYGYFFTLLLIISYRWNFLSLFFACYRWASSLLLLHFLFECITRDEFHGLVLAHKFDLNVLAYLRFGGGAFGGLERALTARVEAHDTVTCLAITLPIILVLLLGVRIFV